jgi:hypothetical protein
VVHDLELEEMQTAAVIGVTDVHARPFANAFEAL